MIRDYFRVLRVDLATGRGRIEEIDGRDTQAGGSGLAALLFDRMGFPDRGWEDPAQPLILAIGPLTGYFPLMSKVVCAFKSPYHDQYAESHAGGRAALSLRFADLDALVITGKTRRPSCLVVGSRTLEVQDVPYLWGKSVQRTGRVLRNMFVGSGHRSILRIGPAGENRSALACINVDSYRHFGRLGGGAAMGAKNLKAIVILGDASFELPPGKAYAPLFEKIYGQLTATTMMDKYHNLGTAANVAVLNRIQALPCRNLQRTSETDIVGITGETFADRTLLRNTACAGCPVGCIHLGFLREKFKEPNQYLYRQVTYDHEPIFALGAMLSVLDPFQVLTLLETAEKAGLDVMSAGVALAWATEASDKGLISAKETLVPLKFGDAGAYVQAVTHLGLGANDFYRLLGRGTMKAAEHYGGSDFACVLGQEMAGYATGEVFFVSQALGFRHSHLDAGGYAYDQKQKGKEAAAAVDFLVQDEKARVLLTSMVACLFAREVYKEDLLAECLKAVGYGNLAETLDDVARRVQEMRWRIRLKTGFVPESVSIPNRFKQVVTWQGPVDAEYMESLQQAYSQRIREMGKPNV
ncbi:MAG: aldehyde ferredoxin oxidoreductase [Desulfobacterota bacterium]|jgi:aldehyde:ferredoxin oxidoreductase|nr:aldehyde ferredoxin oxidoreductase [Thermodesulfobacteriota bacterium]